jgi:hypothetical protein
VCVALARLPCGLADQDIDAARPRACSFYADRNGLFFETKVTAPERLYVGQRTKERALQKSGLEIMKQPIDLIAQNFKGLPSPRPWLAASLESLRS